MIKLAISLEDLISPSAAKAADGLRKLQHELGESKAKLASYQAQLSRAKQLGDVEGYRKYSKLVDESKRSVFDLTQSLEQMAPAAEGAGAALAKGLGVAAGPLGMVAAAAGAASLALAAFAAKGVEIALDVNEVNERLTATYDALGAVPGQGQKTLAFLDSLASKLPQTREQLSQWTRQYESLGITDLGELRQQIKATASAQAIGGNEGAQAYEHLAEKVRIAVEAHQGLKLAARTLTQLYDAGVNVTDVAGRMHVSTQALVAGLKAGTVDAQAFGNALSASLIAKGQKPLEAMGNELGTLRAKGKEVFDHLFDGIDTSPITGAIKGFIQLADQGTASGKQLHKGITYAIQGIVNWIGKMLVEGEVMFLTLELYALKHRSELKAIEKAFVGIGDAIIKVTHGIEWLFSHKDAPGWLLQLMSGGLTGAGLSAITVAGGGKAPAHAQGGLVKEPAAGEYFASVAPGEMILPKRDSRELMGGGLGNMGRAMMMPPANSNAGAGGGATVHIEHLTVQAAAGVTDATQLSATGIAIAFERLRLASGR